MPNSPVAATPHSVAATPHSLAVSPLSIELGTGPSLFLDIVRLTAALLVALGHLSQISEGWGDLIDLAVNSVTAFFLLSGFVIRYVTVRRRGSLPNYFADRASRIYSVLLPCLLLAIVADIIAKRLDGGSNLLHSIDGLHLLAATLANLTFTTYAWHQHLGFYTDGAMWSLAFEWAYYMLYGIAFYLAGWRRSLLLLLVCLIAGPEILTLFPIWLAGCLLFEVFIRVRTLRWFLPAAIATLLAAAGLLALHPVRSHANQLRLSLAALTHNLQAARDTSTSHLFFLVPRLGHNSPVSLNAYIWGALLFVLMLLGLLLADRLAESFTIAAQGRPARTIRLLAEATFPLYLVHLPIFYVTLLLVGHKFTSNAAKLGLLLAVFALSVLLGELFNRYKLTLRRWFLAHLPAPPASNAPSTRNSPTPNS